MGQVTFSSNSSSESDIIIPQNAIEELALKMVPAFMEYNRKMVELNKMREECNQKSIEIQARKNESKIKMEEAKVIMDESQKDIIELEKRKAACILKNQKKLITNMFYAIFYPRKDLSQDEIDGLFDTYIRNASCFLKTNELVNDCIHINSMTPVISFLEDHREITRCNFIHFKTAIGDIATLSDYLALSKCRVKAIGISTNIPQEAKLNLANAIAAKNNQLNVVYK